MTLSGTTLVILAAAVATLLTRLGGHLLLSRWQPLPPRLEAALDAIPAAVLTTLVAPAALGHGWPGLATLGIAALVGIRFGALVMFFAGAAMIVLLRGLAA